VPSLTSHRPRTTSGNIALAWLGALPFWEVPLIVGIRLAEAVMPPAPEGMFRTGVAIALMSAIFFAPIAILVRRASVAFVLQGALGLLFSLYPTFRERTPQIFASDIANFAAFAYLAVALLLTASSFRPLVSALCAPVLAVMATVLSVVGGTVAISALRPQQMDAATLSVLRGIQESPEIRRRHLPAPDVYQILLDGLGRPDVLYDRFGVDLRGSRELLEARGFEIVGNAVANYDQTYLSLASMLNMNYVNALERTMQDLSLRAPLHALIQNNSVATALKTAGYRIVVIGADYGATQDVTVADVCDCPAVVFGEFETVVLGMTPFAKGGLAGLEYIPHRRRILSTLDKLGSFEPASSPAFVLAHVLGPHQPFVLDEGGAAVRPPRAFSFADGMHFPGTRDEFARGYEAQARYLLRRAAEIADELVARSRNRGRHAVVIIHGDHSVRFRGSTFQPTPTEGLDVLPVLLAIRWSPSQTSPQPVRSLVNVYREFLRRYFDSPIEHLPDRAFVASYATPYRLIEAQWH
jgi:hypothetical protein